MVDIDFLGEKFYTISDLVLLTGQSEPDIRKQIKELDGEPAINSGKEVFFSRDARRILESVARRHAGPARPLLPGLSPVRLCALMRDAIVQSGLDLTDKTILTEAASGAYAATAIISALAGARRVYALARPSEHGSVAEVTDWTIKLASFAGVADRVSVAESIPPDTLREVDIVTNSGNLRPITAELIDNLQSRSVIALMFEAWEFRDQDIDLAACRRRHIPVVGVNEQHPSVDVFAFLGPLCVKLLHDAGIAVYRNRLALLCDNSFADPILGGLTGLGAIAHHFSSVEALHPERWDAVIVALKPACKFRVGAREAAHIASASLPGVVVAQLWGDIDREALLTHDLRAWPLLPPQPGHMAILLSAIGPDPIVRLQAGGLRAAEWILRGGSATPNGIAQLVD